MNCLSHLIDYRFCFRYKSLQRRNIIETRVQQKVLKRLKRKKVEKAVLRIAAGMPDEAVEQESIVPATSTKTARNEP